MPLAGCKLLQLCKPAIYKPEKALHIYKSKFHTAFYILQARFRRTGKGALRLLQSSRRNRESKIHADLQDMMASSPREGISCTLIIDDGACRHGLGCRCPHCPWVRRIHGRWCCGGCLLHDSLACIGEMVQFKTGPSGI